jgi:DNA-binding MarR family transcriptional regulator
MTERETGPITEPSPSPAVNVLNPAPPVLGSASSDPLRLMRWALRDARHPKLTGTVRAVLGAIIDRYPDMRPSVPRIAADAGVSRATAFRAIGDLRALGVLSSKSSDNGKRGVCSVYTVDAAAIASLKSASTKMTSKARPQKRANPSQVATGGVSSCDGSDTPNHAHGEHTSSGDHAHLAHRPCSR